MKWMKRAAAVVMSLTMLFSMAACGGGDESGEKAGTSKDTMQEILDRGTIRVGLSLNGFPMGSRDDEGNPIGYDADWANKLAETLGVELEVIDVDTDTRISAVESGRVDIIFSNITGTLERAKTIDFSIPYLITGTKMLTLAGCSYNEITDLDSPDITVAVCTGSMGEALMNEHAPSANLIYVGNFNEGLLQVEQGKAVATFEDASVVDYTAKESGGKLEGKPTIYGTDPICAGVAKGDMEWLYWINMFISTQISNGWQGELFENYWC